MTGPVRLFARSLSALVLTFGLASPSSGKAQQRIAPDAGCMEQKGQYTCNWSSFLLAFDRSHTVAIQAGHLDRSAASQLRSLIAQLGKIPATEGQPADLTFAVSSVTPTGVNLGPGDHDLAQLLVSAPTTASPQRALLWAEVYRGQGDRPWPAQVQGLLAQFRDRFPRHN